MRIANKIVVVTGGLSGLGAATVQGLEKQGAHVAVLDLILPEKTEGSETARLRFFKVDVSNAADVAEATAGVISWSKEIGLDIGAIVCCAGFLGSAKILSKGGNKISLERFKKVVNISLIGTVDVVRHLLPHMAKQQPDSDDSRGVVITVASAAAFDGQEGQVAYSAAKGAIAAMTLPMARDLSSQGIRAVCIAPGTFGTNMVAGMPPRVQQSLERSMEYPHRAGRPYEFAALVQHVIENNMLNGTVIRLDGASRMPSRL